MVQHAVAADGVTRRSLVAGAAGAGLAGIALAGVGAGIARADAAEPAWDCEADVVVVGTGFAGLAAAIEAFDAGASVIVIEKAPEEGMGGNSRVSNQAIWSPTNVEASISFFKELEGEYHLKDIPEASIEAYINEAAEHSAWLTKVLGIDFANMATYMEYPLAPSAEEAMVDDLSIAVSLGLGYSAVWAPLKEAAMGRDITFKFETPMSDLVYDANGAVVGVKAAPADGEIAIKANKAVILCPGGFEHDTVMQANYLRFPTMAWGSIYNTGDVHKICQKYDIDFWHMNSATPATRMGLKLPGDDPATANAALDLEIEGYTRYFWTDKYGKRFMDETRSAQHGYGRSDVFYNDSMKMEWPRIPLWQVFDQSVADGLTEDVNMGWQEMVLGRTVSANFEQEIAEGLVFKADTPEELAELMGLGQDFVDTFNTYTAAAESGEDDEFGRLASNLGVLEPPYYAASVYPVMVNTNGGPRRNERCQVLKTDGTPVEHLYSAGEFGSIWAWYYQGAGNVSESLATGRIAARNAVAE